ncbi:MAG: hypothetical protein IJA10_09730 [Lachnospiraceae bacterium]|nr:hypothetical protein [Lachnospiraceae bacterium]
MEKNIPDMDFDIMWLDEKVGHICIKDEEIVDAEQYDCENYKRFLPYCHITIALLSRLLQSRCWDKNRANINEILSELGLNSYNPFEIVKKTRGIDYDDKFWFRFKGEESLCWDDVDPRRVSL